MLIGLARSLRATFRAVGLGARRSSKWPVVEREFLARTRACEACGSVTKLQVHHVLPFHLHPDRELDPSNLVALCMGRNACHLLIGHGDNFRAYTPDLGVLLEKLRARRMTLVGARQVALATRVYG